MPTPVSRSISLPPINQRLVDQVAHIFDEAQKSSANHVKNYVSLYKVHSIYARHTESIYNSEKVKAIGERKFQRVIQGHLIKVLPLKKGEVSADRVSSFLGGYLKFINEKGEIFSY